MVVDTQCPGLEVIGWFDADGDGVLERIVANGGNTARYAWLYDQMCSPLPGAGSVSNDGFMYEAGGAACAPGGCTVAVTCDPGTSSLIVRSVSPVQDVEQGFFGCDR